MDDAVMQRVRDLVEPVVAAAGLELYDVERRGAALVVSVDQPHRSSDGDGVDLDRLAALSRDISRALDDADPVPGRYTLEVSSPGLERPLRTPSHFAGAVGRTVTCKLRPPAEPRRVRGVLVEAGDRSCVIELDDPPGQRSTVDYDDLERARTVFEWGAQERPARTRR